MSTSVRRIFDLTENEHYINNEQLLKLCTKIGVRLTYERLQPHIPMKRLAIFEFNDDSIIDWLTFDNLFYTEKG